MNELVFLENEQALTTSRIIAESFEKTHSEIIYAIEGRVGSDGRVRNNGLIDQLEMNGKSQVSKMFIKSDYKDSASRTQREYLVTKDGFTLLAMGLTGEKALEFKLKYIEAFNQMEKQLQEIYHISETALTNNIMSDIIPMLNNEIQKMTNKMDERFEMYEENYRPTHANKMKINRYIKERLGSEQEENEAELVKQRVLLMLNAEYWQDIPYKQLIENMYLIDQSIDTVKGSRVRRQTELFNDFL